ncbi:protein mono-ADP-ribosyltransferase PARP14-like isoform 2-T2 [Menidia menidia]
MAECAPLSVEGAWGPEQGRSLKNKLQLYFQSRRRSGGGDCRVELEAGAPRAAVYFRSEEVRQRVLDRKNHEVIVEQQTVKLQLSSAQSPASGDGVSDLRDSEEPKSEPEAVNEAAANPEEPVAVAPGSAVVLQNLSENMSRELLLMLVENLSGLDEKDFSLEVIWESSTAVVLFSQPAVAVKFLSDSGSSSKLQKHGLTARQLEAAGSVRLENLPQTTVKEMLELWFEKNWEQPLSIEMIPEEQAAIATFSDPKVVENICTKVDHVICSSGVQLFPFYPSLGAALYGERRPAWRLPAAFSQRLDALIWRFLRTRRLEDALHQQMRRHLCGVRLAEAEPEAWLRPLPAVLRQPGLTAERLDGWRDGAQRAFCALLDQYSAFEVPVSAEAWRAADGEVRAAVGEAGAVLAFDASRGVLTVAGQADGVRAVRAPVENLVLRAKAVRERQTRSLTEQVPLPPPRFFMLEQAGLRDAARDVSPELTLSYREAQQTLDITGLPEEVLKAKCWILEKNGGMRKRPLTVPQGVLQYLRTVDPMDMSQSLFTAQGIGAIYSREGKGLVLLGASAGALDQAESQMKAKLAVQTVAVEDQQVLRLPGWLELTRQLLDSFNTSSRKVVSIRVEGGERVVVAGFLSPVNEVCGSLRDFVHRFSRVEDSLRVQSQAAVLFIQRNRTEVWAEAIRQGEVSVQFDPQRPRIAMWGARLHVQSAKQCFQQLAGGLVTDTLTVDKPGAKKYFLSQENPILSSIMAEFSCVVALQSEEEEEAPGDLAEDGCCYQNPAGVRVSVSRADICSFPADAVVNAANEELQHLGGVALALLRAAGAPLQDACSRLVAQRGKLRPGQAVVTDGFQLPCRHVVHAVGPRFGEWDRPTAVGLLAAAVQESLREAQQAGCRSVALPAVSSGVFGFPLQLCADTIARAVREHLDGQQGGAGSLTDVHLLDIKDDTVRAMAAAVSREFGGTRWATSSRTPGPGGRQRGRGRGHSHSPSERGGRGGGGGRGGRGGGGRGGTGFQGDKQSFSRDVSGQRSSGNQEGAAAPQPLLQSQHSSASFGQVSSPSLGVYHMQMGRLALQVSSGDITKEACDVIVNSSNHTFNLQAGVSKAILDGAGRGVLMECSQIVSSPGYQPQAMIMTSAGKLPSQNILHIVGRNEPSQIREVVGAVLKACEEQKFSSVAFPALGTGQGGAPPAAVADAMVGAVVDFVRKSSPKSVSVVKMVIFQANMISDFHNSMKKKQGEDVEEKSVFGKIKDKVSSLFGHGPESQRTDVSALEKQEFEPAVFQLCADNQKAVNSVKKRINELVVREQAEQVLKDPFILKLSQSDLEQLKALQAKLTVRIRLDRGGGGQEPAVRLEGLTRDVFTATSAVSEIIRKVEREENLRSKALLVSSLVEWQHLQPDGSMAAFDIYSNLKLEEALEKKDTVELRILREKYTADPNLKTAKSKKHTIELLRRDLKADFLLPSHWADMQSDLVKLFPVTAGSQEYNNVQTELTKTGLSLNIISIERVQNTTLWKSYQLLKEQMEVKNKHQNNEKMLFHGTSISSVDLINSTGFNRSYAGQHGAMFGKGSYFAVDPAYSAQRYAQPDASGLKRMYQARVLVGDFTKGNNGLLAPPAKSGNTADLYNSVTDSSSNPSMFVVFNDIQAYPEYLITFT